MDVCRGLRGGQLRGSTVFLIEELGEAVYERLVFRGTPGGELADYCVASDELAADTRRLVETLPCQTTA